MSDSAKKVPPRVHALAGWRRWLLRPLAWLLWLWGRTLVFSPAPAPHQAQATMPRPVIFALWHNRLFIAPELFRRHRQDRIIHGLVSPSRDGAWLEAFFSLVGIRAVRGSSHKRGREAALELIGLLRQGRDFGITPDGPRGPCYGFKPGALLVARQAGATLYLMGASFEAAYRLPSWDGFFLPRPFSRVHFNCLILPPAALREATPESLAALLSKINSDAPGESPGLVV